MTYRSTHTEVASWYGPGFAGRPTSTGETYNPEGLTAASRTLPLGSHVRVTNPDTGRSVVVRINDRGPFVHGRSLDLSHGAAQQIGLTGKGVGRVQVTPTATSTPAASWPEANYASSAMLRPDAQRELRFVRIADVDHSACTPPSLQFVAANGRQSHRRMARERASSVSESARWT